MASRAEYVFVLDSQWIIYPRALARLAELSQRTGSAVIYSQMVLSVASARLGTADVWAQEYFDRGDYIGSVALIRRSAWSIAGGYDERGTTPEYDLLRKFIGLGLEGVFIPEILVSHIDAA